MSDTEEKQLLNFLVGKDLLARLDDFRFEHRFSSRAAAIKWLLERALNLKLKPKETDAR